VIGTDVLLAPLQAAVSSPDGAPLVSFVQASAGRMPIAAASIDFVWCRDMLVHVKDLDTAMQECRRILRPGAGMLVWLTMETELMQPSEAAQLYPPLGIVPQGLSKKRLEEAFAGAGLDVLQSEMLGDELIEFYEERDGRASRELIRIARMRRRREELIAAWGRTRYDAAYALYHWIVYHLLGKLSSGYYLLENRL
jgi:SAM-dependent methyltransferase